MSATDFRLDSACLPLHRLAAFEQTILDGVQDLLLVLAPDGRVLHVSPMCFALTTLTPEHLLGNYIASFMHYDDMPVFLAEFQASMAAGSPWRFHHRLRRTDGTFAIFESTQPAACFGLNKCVMTLRPYSNPSVVLMDSYLDHFTTNARLMERLKQLRSEIEDSDEEVDEGEEVVQKIEVCVPITIKAKTKVSSSRILIELN
jgi:PAS domain-containing protein